MAFFFEYKGNAQAKIPKEEDVTDTCFSTYSVFGNLVPQGQRGVFILKGQPNNVERGTVRRGDIFYADLSPVVGSEQGGVRPVLIVQNNVGNRFSPTVIAAAITSQTGKNKLPTHIEVQGQPTGDGTHNGLAKNSIILLEQIRTIDKKRLKEKMGHLDDHTMHMVDEAITVSFGLGDSEATM